MIGDQLKRDPVPPRYSDPEELLAGKCMTCGTVVSCLRRDAVKRADGKELGAWGDLLSVECPGHGRHCGARVFLMSATEFQRVVA